MRAVLLEDDLALVTTRPDVSTIPAGAGQFLVTHPAKPGGPPRKHERALNDHLTSQHVAAVRAHYRIKCVLDVGANVGQYVGSLRAAGYDGYVVSFEPVTSTFSSLWPASEFGRARYRRLQEPTAQEVRACRLDSILDEVTAHVPDRRGMPRFPESLAAYEAAGFEITGLYPASREHRTGRVLEFDCVMVRASAAD